MVLNNRKIRGVFQILITSYQEDELLIWSNLDHRNIVQLYGAIRADSHIYILAEFIDGELLIDPGSMIQGGNLYSANNLYFHVNI